MFPAQGPRPAIPSTTPRAAQATRAVRGRSRMSLPTSRKHGPRRYGFIPRIPDNAIDILLEKIERLWRVADALRNEVA